MKYTHVVWDFNGTIVDDVSICIECVNCLLSRRGLPVIDSVERYRQVFCFPIVKYYEKIGFDFSTESFGDVAIEWVDEYMKRFYQATINNDVVEMLKKTRRSNTKNILVSATEICMLKEQLSTLGITSLFDEVYGLDNIHAQNKISLAESWKKNNRAAKTLLVGDTEHDFETAKAIDADCVIYAGGHQPRESLVTFGVPVIDKMSELENFFDN